MNDWEQQFRAPFEEQSGKLRQGRLSAHNQFYKALKSAEYWPVLKKRMETEVFPILEDHHSRLTETLDEMESGKFHHLSALSRNRWWTSWTAWITLRHPRIWRIRLQILFYRIRLKSREVLVRIQNRKSVMGAILALSGIFLAVILLWEFLE